MTNLCVRWSMLMAVACFCVTLNSEANGGEFLKRLFGRKCRTVVAPRCPPAACRPIQEVRFGMGPINDRPSCPVNLILEVQYLDGGDWKCAYRVFRASDCDSATASIHVPCDVVPRYCVDKQCCDDLAGTNCGMEVSDLGDISAIVERIGDEPWMPERVPGAMRTFVSNRLGNGFPKPDAGEQGMRVTLNVAAADVVENTEYRAQMDGKYYRFHRVRVNIDGVESSYGVGYQVTEEDFERANSGEDISSYLVKGIPPISGYSRSFNFAENRNTFWVWNYNVVEFVP